jgi:hypothetical protein
MKRHAFDGADDQSHYGSASSQDSPPARKQARPDERTAIEWQPRSDMAAAEALCGRIADGTADAADLYEALRLVHGSMGAGTSRARLLSPAVDPCWIPLRAYGYMWQTLAQSPAAVAAVRQSATGWPPTFVDVQRAYTLMDPSSAYEHVRQLDLEAADDLHTPAYALAQAMADTARRSEAVARSPAGIFGGSIEPFAVVWHDVLDPREPAFIGACDPTQAYYILVAQSDAGSRVGLFAMDINGNATLLATSYTPTGTSPLDGEHVAHVDRMPDWVGYDTVMPLFLAALGYEPGEAATAIEIIQSRRINEGDGGDGDDNGDDDDVLASWRQTAAFFEPPPAGMAQVRRTLLPVASRFAVPPGVRQEIALGQDGDEDSWFDADLSDAWLDDCRLFLAIRLFQGQLEARGAQTSLAQRPLSLVDAAARAYRGPLWEQMAPEALVDWAAVYAWQGTCAGPASPAGLLPMSERLLDVARLWGYPVDPSQARRPELLCAPLAPEAFAHISAAAP